MIKLKNDSENIERVLDGKKAPAISKEEEIGYHKGALNTLVNERNEIFKMIQIVESLMQAHLKRLEELGVRIQQEKR